MGILWTERKVKVSRIVNATYDKALHAIQNPPIIIRLNPLVIALKQDDVDAGLWHITDRLKVFGYTSTMEYTYTAKIKLRENGIDSDVSRSMSQPPLSADCLLQTHAPATHLSNYWRVRSIDSKRSEITEEVIVRTYRGLMGYVESTLRREHIALLDRLAAYLEDMTDLQV